MQKSTYCKRTDIEITFGMCDVLRKKNKAKCEEKRCSVVSGKSKKLNHVKLSLNSAV